MTQVFLSIGTNIERQQHLAVANTALSGLFGAVVYSSIYESESVGFTGDPFYNLVAQVDTSLSIGELSKALKDIEDATGRDRNAPKFSGRTLDIDLLTYGDAEGIVEGILLPRPEILEQAFVLWPLAELVPHECLPGTQTTFKALWHDYQQAHPEKAQALHPIALNMHALTPEPSLSFPL